MIMSKIKRFQIKSFLASLTLLCFLCACSVNRGKGEDSSIKVVNPDDVKIHQEISETDMESLDLPSFGIMDFRIADSIMFTSVTHSPGIWHLYSLPSLDSIGHIIDLGSGPLELPMPLPCGLASFLNDGEGRMDVSIPINETGKLLEFKTRGKLTAEDWNESAKTVSAPLLPSTVWAYNLGNDMIYQARVIPDSCKLERSLRSISNDSVLPVNPAVTVLNARKAESMGEIASILSKPAISPDASKMAEISGLSNEILIFAPQSENYITVRYPEINFESKEIMEMAARGISLFGAANGYDDFFAVVRKDIKDATQAINNPGAVGNYIDFIAWDGTSLGSLKIDLPNLTSFDIDTSTNTLYLLNHETDQINSVDMTSFFNSLTPKTK